MRDYRASRFFCFLVVAILAFSSFHLNASTVEVVKADFVKRSKSIKFFGSTFNKEVKLLSFPTDGLVESVLVERGDVVVKGQVLAELDTTTLTLERKRALAKLERSRKELNRSRSLYNKRSISLYELEIAITDVEIYKAELALIEYNINYAKIKAPADGIIQQSFTEPGQFLVKHKPVVSFYQQTNAWYVRANISTKDITRISVGDPVFFSSTAYPNRQFYGSVFHIAVDAESKTKNFTVEIKIDPQDVAMLAGLSGSGVITPSADRAVVLLPISSVSQSVGQRASVYRLNDNYAIEDIEVTIAYIDNDCIAISAGLSNNDRVLAKVSDYYDLERGGVQQQGALDPTRVLAISGYCLPDQQRIGKL